MSAIRTLPDFDELESAAVAAWSAGIDKLKSQCNLTEQENFIAKYQDLSEAVKQWSFKKHLSFLHSQNGNSTREAEAALMNKFLTAGPITVQVKSLSAHAADITWGGKDSNEFLGECGARVESISSTLKKVAEVMSQLALINCILAAPDFPKSWPKVVAWVKSIANLTLADLPPEIAAKAKERGEIAGQQDQGKPRLILAQQRCRRRLPPRKPSSRSPGRGRRDEARYAYAPGCRLVIMRSFPASRIGHAAHDPNFRVTETTMERSKMKGQWRRQI